VRRGKSNRRAGTGGPLGRNKRAPPVLDLYHSIYIYLHANTQRMCGSMASETAMRAATPRQAFAIWKISPGKVSNRKLITANSLLT